MRKPLATLSLVLGAGLGVLTTADALAAQPPGSSTPSSKVPPAPPTVPSSTTVHPSNAVSGAAIVQEALKYLGYPYTATGNSPSTGFSCIGFASWVYRQLGIPLPGDLQDAMNFAPLVPFSQLQPGDLLYFKNTIWNGLSHVAIYIGGGRFVHAEYYGYGVRISSFNNDPRDGNYWIAHYLGANRPWGGAAMAPVVSTFPATPAAPTTTVNKVVGGVAAVVTAPSLNVRTGPSMTATVATVVPGGTSVTIISKSNGWDRVQLPDGSEGWVKATYVSTGGSVAAPATTSTTNPNIGTPKAPTPAGQPSPTSGSAVTSAHHATTTSRVSGLRVHSAPSTSAPVVTGLAQGQRVTVLRRSGAWTKIRTANGQVGWVMSSYTSGGSQASTAAGTTTYNSYSSKAAKRATSTTATQSYFRGNARVTAGVRVHAGPSLTARVIGGIAAGTRVQVLGRIGTWARVRTATGQVGYVYGAYVR